MPTYRLNILRVATSLLYLAAAWSQPGPAPIGGAGAPSPSTADCSLPEGAKFPYEVDIPSQRAALDLLFGEARHQFAAQNGGSTQLVQKASSEDFDQSYCMQLTASTFSASSSDTSPESVGMLIGATFGRATFMKTISVRLVRPPRFSYCFYIRCLEKCIS